VPVASTPRHAKRTSSISVSEDARFIIVMRPR
jgi:hypothetical protein